MLTLSTLYKKTTTGSIQYWTISVHNLEIHTDYGQVGTINPQHTVDVINEGKNYGRSNATTAFEQAIAEAKAKWTKQKKKGYVESIEDAQNEVLDAVITGGVSPMLAHKFSQHGHKIIFPCYGQYKLDGVRCIAILKDGICTLWSRTRKPITSMPHIIEEIENNFDEDIILDGELYNHEYKSNFESIVSLVRQDEPHSNHRAVQYHIYDIINEYPWHSRWATLLMKFPLQSTILALVYSEVLEDEEDINEYFAESRQEGYEGVMLRNKDGKYVNKRSYDLQKVKEFDDAEFPIVGIEEGRGKLMGHVGAFICMIGDKQFSAKMSGDIARLKEFFDVHSLWQGKMLTVQYQGLTGYGIPRFPVGLSIRDYE